MLARSLNKLRAAGLRLSRCRGALSSSLNRPPATYTPAKLAALYRELEDRLNRLPGVEGSGLALYNPLTDNWGEMILVAGHPPPKPGEQRGASWDRVSADYLQNFGVTMVRGRALHRGRQRNDGAGRRRQRSVREALLQERRRSARPALRPGPAGERRHVPHRRRRARREVRRLRAEPAGAADVLRAARAEGGLQGRADDSGSSCGRTSSAASCWSPARRRARSSRCSRKALAEVDPESDDHQRADDAAAGGDVVRSGARRSRASPGCSGSSRWCSRRSACTA